MESTYKQLYLDWLRADEQKDLLYVSVTPASLMEENDLLHPKKPTRYTITSNCANIKETGIPTYLAEEEFYENIVGILTAPPPTEEEMKKLLLL